MNKIETQMHQMRLSGMAIRWKSLVETRRHTELSLNEGLEILLQSEQQERENRRFERLRKNARFRYQAAVEEIIYDASRGINRDLIAELSTGNYLSQGQSVLITGAAGCGKSFIASALGHRACAQGYKTTYFNTQKLLMKTKMSRAEGTILKFFNQLAKTDLLILDDFGLTQLGHQQQMDLMEIIEDRHSRRSTIIASQLPVSNWFDIIQEATIADAILDRLVHTSYRIELKGESLRKKL